MRKIISALCLLVLGNVAALSAGCEGVCVSTDWPSPNNYSVDVGFRRDKVQWSIAGPYFDGSYHPNVLSELTWHDLRIVQVSGTGSYVSCRNYAVKFAGDYGSIYHGESKDADYAGNNKTDLFSLSSNDAGKGSVYDLSGGVGYRLTSRGGRCIITPLIGYSYHAQNLHMYDGFQKFCFDFESGLPCQTGPIEGLNTSYKTHWFGPWFGVDFVVQAERCAYVFGGIEWHLITYRGTGNWNLRDDIGPFHHSANGQGVIGTLGANWEIWNNWSIGLVSNYRYFKTRQGREHLTFFASPGNGQEIELRLNKVKWVSGDISALVAWRF